MICFIDEHRSVLGVEPICRLLPIAPSTHYEVIAKRTDVGRLSARERSDISMKVEIRRVFNENFQAYGVRKVWRQLQREGFDVARCTVARLMRMMGLQGVIRGKPVKTTVSDKSAPCPLDRVRYFKAPAPNMLWLSDFTYVATWQGFVYVAFVIDASARRIVGWRASRLPMRASSSMLWTRLFMIGGPSIAAGSSIIPTGACNTCRSNIPSGCRRRALSRLSGAWRFL
jgi:hypothetical protein